MTTNTTPVPAVESIDSSNARKRKAHKKSRLGCRNCKLRRVKCDENKPMCDKCQEFGVSCNFNPAIPDLQPRPAEVNVVCMDMVFEESLTLANGVTLDMIDISLRRDTSVIPGKRAKPFDCFDLARLERFQTRTVLTIGTKSTSGLFRKELVRLACTHPFLMHLVQSVTAGHDRYLSGSATSRPSQEEVHHVNQALSMFQNKLSNPVRPQDRDALFVAASLLGVMAFFNVESANVEEVWPFKNSDFGWLNLSDGKYAVWQVTDPLRFDSIWRPLAEMYQRDFMPPIEFEDCAPSVFDHLCCANVNSEEAALNPYDKTVRVFAPLFEKECVESTWLSFLAFLCHIDPPFKTLLRSKDPWAMLMLAYWFMKICRGPWWASPRAILQGQAICLYIERYYPDDPALQRALLRPRKELEAAQNEGVGGFSPAVSRWM